MAYTHYSIHSKFPRIARTLLSVVVVLFIGLTHRYLRPCNYRVVRGPFKEYPHMTV